MNETHAVSLTAAEREAALDYATARKNYLLARRRHTSLLAWARRSDENASSWYVQCCELERVFEQAVTDATGGVV